MKRILYLLSLCLIQSLVYAQSNYNNNTISSPSNGSSFLATSGPTKLLQTIDVDLYTGSPIVSIPIFNLDSKDISIPVSLSYIAGRGIKVTDVANTCGLGWQLNGGGSISRVIRGKEDENTWSGYLGTRQLGGYLNTLLSNGGTPLTTAQKNELDSHYGIEPITQTTFDDNLLGLIEGGDDGEPDVFYVNTPFANFHFTFDYLGNPVIPNNKGYKIISNLYGHTGLSPIYFKIIDDKGDEYDFGSTVNSQDGVKLYYPTEHYHKQSGFVPITWFLDKIITYNSKDVITFNYVTGTTYKIFNHNSSAVAVQLYNQVNGYSTSVNNGHLSAIVQYMFDYPTDFEEPKYLSSIVSSIGEVDFSYVNDRLDFPEAYRLSTITAKAYNPSTQTNNTVLKIFGFNYSYFGLPSTLADELRLKLNNITVAGNTPSTISPLILNSFDYNLSSNLPGRKSPQFDAWDYYNYDANASPNTWSIVPGSQNRNPNLNSASANILTGVHNILGETTTIQYELNTYSLNERKNILCGGLRVKQVSKNLQNGETLKKQYVYNDDFGNSTGTIYSYSQNGSLKNFFDFYSASFIHPPLTSDYWTVSTYAESPYNYIDLDGNFIGYASVKELNQNGSYSISKFSNFVDFPDVESVTMRPNYPGTATTTSGPPPPVFNQLPDMIKSVDNSYKRGLLKNKIAYSAADIKVTEETNTYATLSISSSPASFGFRPVPWSYGFTYYKDYGNYSAWDQDWYYYRSYEYYGTYKENYRITQTITKVYDQVNINNFVQTTSDYSYCPDNHHVRCIRTNDSKGNTESKTFYHANDTGIPMLDGGQATAINNMVSANYTSAPVHETHTKNAAMMQTHSTFTSGTPASNGIPEVLPLNTSFYNNSTQIAQQQYSFNQNTLNLIGSSTQNGKPVAIAYDYNNTYPVAKIVNANSTYIPLQATGSIGNSFTSSYSTQFTSGYTGTIAWSIYAGSGSVPVGSTVTITYSLSGPANKSGTACLGSNAGCTSYTTASFQNMPAGSYSVTVTITGSTGTFYLTGGYPLLQSVLTNEYYFEGFEQAGWGNNVTLGGAHTGNGYYNASIINYPVSYVTPNSRKYILQYWNMVNGKWIFKEQPYTGPVTLTGKLDDIRIFPEDAQMTTYTYNPLAGKTSETDPSGKTIYYEYDGLGRQSVTRDNDKNIISKQCYNYAGQPDACPINAYYNAERSQAYTKACSPGYTGSTVTYTVPAGEYSSATSQAEADQLAVSDINTNGVNYTNTNGSCTFIYYNVQQSQTYTKVCASDYAGSRVTYTVPAAKYNSVISQADADQLAINDINTNGLNYVNTNGRCALIYYNTQRSLAFTKICEAGYPGSTVTYTVPAGTDTSTISQSAADQLAIDDININGQNYANAYGTCPFVYYSAEQSKIFAKSCPAGYSGSVATYTVPARRYTSIISQAEADQLAINDINTNGQNNADAAGRCVLLYFNAVQSRTFRKTCAPGYIGSEVTYTVPANTYSSISQTGADIRASQDILDNGQNYANANGTCAIIYYNAQRNQAFIKSCSAGYAGTSSTYTVPANKYSSVISQEAADQLAINDINTNGQNYANANGVCNFVPPSCSFVAATGFNMLTSGITTTSTTVTFYIAVSKSTGSINWSATNIVATISGGCKPSSNRNFNVTSSGRTWGVTVSTNGQVSIRLTSGTAPTSTSPAILTGPACTFSL